jgi:hypothetical protein
MPVGLPSAAETAPDPDFQVVELFSLGGLTLSFYLFHLVPAVANAMLLLSCTG